MSDRPYPEEGRQGTLRVLDEAGYVERPEFTGESNGYFCITCTKFDVGHTARAPGGYVNFLCKGLRVPVAPHGCCNYWVYAEPWERE